MIDLTDQLADYRQSLAEEGYDFCLQTCDAEDLDCDGVRGDREAQRNDSRYPRKLDKYCYHDAEQPGPVEEKGVDKSEQI